MCILFVYTLLVFSYYDLSVFSMSMINGFPKIKVWMEGGWVG